MKIKITRKTLNVLDLHREAPRQKGTWNVNTLDGYCLIDIDNQVATKLTKMGASLDDPKSIEKVILQTIKE